VYTERLTLFCSGGHLHAKLGTIELWEAICGLADLSQLVVIYHVDLTMCKQEPDCRSHLWETDWLL
jgi:hypothetical protein